MGSVSKPGDGGAVVAWVRRNWFFLALLGVIAAGVAAPGLGGRQGLLQGAQSGNVAVFLLFILQGLLLPTESLVRGMMSWRLNLAIQSFIFVLIPALVVPWLLILDGRVAPEFLLGFIYLAVMPTTVATAVVYTNKAGGDAGCALFNATWSNVFGIVFVPLALSLYLQRSGDDIPVLAMLGRLALLIIVPLIIGQVLRPFVREWVFRRRTQIAIGANLLVLYIVYIAFCNSVLDGVWRATPVQSLIVVFILTGLLLLLVCVLALLLVRFLKLDYGKGVAAFFLTTQKTIATGIPMAQSLFGDSPAIGVIILPLMIYHFAQLALGGFIIGALKNRSD